MKETYCFFSAQYLPTTGGVERYTYNMAKELTNRGNEVIIVTSALHGLPESEIDENGIVVLRVATLSIMGGRMRISFPFLSWRKICKKLDEMGITRVIIQTRLYTLSILGMNYAKEKDIPSIVIEHGTSYVGMRNPLLSFCERCYENTLMRWAKQKSSSFFAVSKAGIEWLRYFGIQAKGVLYNSVDYRAIERNLESPRYNVRDRYNIPLDTTLVSFVGRLIPEKGIKQLVEAVSTLREQKVYLLVVGEGYIRNSLPKETNIIYIGNVLQEEVMTILGQSDIFCLPSDSEGFPTSVVEAVLCRCFVITTPFGGAKELISSDEYGMIIEDNSKEKIKAALLEAVSSPEKCRLATENALQKFYSGFTWEKTCDALEKYEWRN